MTSTGDGNQARGTTGVMSYGSGAWIVTKPTDTPPARDPHGTAAVTAEEREHMRLFTQAWPCEVVVNGRRIAVGVTGTDYVRDVPRLLAALATAEAERDTAVALLIEWREADADERDTLKAECRRHQALWSMSGFVDAHPTYLALLAKERG